MLPKKGKSVDITFTQDQLLEEAKITEEDNLASLYHLQALEQEKRNIVKRSNPRLVGPVIRFHSFIEGRITGRKSPLVEVISDVHENTEISETFEVNSETSSHERISRNLVTFIGFDNRTSIFGENLYPIIEQVQKKQICPITGEPAKYVDPKTGVPYANQEAHRIIQSLLEGQFAWSSLLKTYIHRYDFQPTTCVPIEFIKASIGYSVDQIEKMAVEEEFPTQTQSQNSEMPTTVL
ncbi:Vacuolar protein sorting-associated protein 72 [Nowakowskiella sp. JEL0078]|nr:Vacuolar protein sorting-associated protein 72 [Nowakowskiella sp. JEL0078]